MAKKRALFEKPFRLIRFRFRRAARNPLVNMRRRSATVIGAVLLGLVALAFAELADLAHDLFLSLVSALPYAPLILTPAIFGSVMYITIKMGKAAGGSGIPQVMAATRDPGLKQSQSLVSLRVAMTKFLMTIFMLFGGASVGREGPTVQVSAAIMVLVHKLFRVRLTAGVMIAGGAAGVSAAFNTPLAGIAFAIEELAAAYEQRVAVLVMGAVMISGMVSLGIAGDYIYFGAMHGSMQIGTVLVVAPVAGVLGGLAGGLFSKLLLGVTDGDYPFLAWGRKRPVVFATICGLAVAAIGIGTDGLTWGTGYETTRQLVEGQNVNPIFGPGKFVATLLTAASGVPGGIFAPSLAVGAGFGHLLAPFFPSGESSTIILLGMVAYFVGVVRAPLTAVIILIEATAARGMVLPMFATALIAEASSSMICSERLYHGLSKRFMKSIEADRVATDLPSSKER